MLGDAHGAFSGHPRPRSTSYLKQGSIWNRSSSSLSLALPLAIQERSHSLDVLAKRYGRAKGHARQDPEAGSVICRA